MLIAPEILTFRREQTELLVRPLPEPSPSPIRLLGHAALDDRPFVLLSGAGDAALSDWSYGALEASGDFDTFEAAHRAVVPRGARAPLSGTQASRPETTLAGERFVRPPPPIADGLPPFTGGVVGYVGYDVGWRYAAKPRSPRPGPLGMPGERLHAFDAIYARNERSGKGFVITTTDRDARDRGDRLFGCLARTGRTLVGGLVGPLTPRWRRATHTNRVAEALRLIRDGEIYQINLTYALKGRYEGSPAAALARLSRSAPPFAGYLRVSRDAHLVSASPECFCDLRADGRIRVFPIKGTRPRSICPKEDAALAAALAADPKERAEHLMIVDLLRNDLGRIAVPGSVSVRGLAYVESFPTVHHLTSRVEAYLRPRLSPKDFLRATFPGGSITGAPKLRAMETIDDLEEQARGVYTGALLWLDHGGAMRASIAIRTAQIRDGELRFGVGGGIVADSNPAREWEETLVKAQALTAALQR